MTNKKCFLYDIDIEVNHELTSKKGRLTETQEHAVCGNCDWKSEIVVNDWPKLFGMIRAHIEQ